MTIWPETPVERLPAATAAVGPAAPGWSRHLPAADAIRALTYDPRLRYVLGVALLAGLYYGSAKVGFELEFAGPVAAIVWLPVGVAIAFLYLAGLRFLPGVLIGDLLANDYGALPVGSALGQTVGNLLEVTVATLLIRRLVRGGWALGSVRNVMCVFVAIAAGATVSATIGPLSLLAGGAIDADELASVWRTWWLGDAAGAVVVVPFAIAWYRPWGRQLTQRRTLEALLLVAALAGFAELALHGHRPLTYLLFPALIFAALRFGQRGATLAIVVTVGLTVWNTTHYQGPFALDSVTRSVLNTQLFIAVAALSTLCLAAAVSERQRFAESLAASRSRLVAAADTERRRLERNLHDGAQQRLTALALRLHESRRRARHAPGEIDGLFEDAEAQVKVAIDELRELARGIHPAALTTNGLANAIRDIAAQSPVTIDLVDLPTGRVGDAAEATAYYVVSEALTNAQRHAQASVISVRVVVARGVLTVEVADDGIGSAVVTPDSGLQGLRDRVEAVGGTFRVSSPPGRGTRVVAAIPAGELH
jgi:signal transduction histidine kinase